MKDLTKGSILSHTLVMAAPVAIGMLTQIAYQLVNLYFVAELGSAATAGVNAAGNAIFIITALTQVLGVGTAALVAHAAGRKDQADANVVLNQSMLLALVFGAFALFFLGICKGPYLRLVASDAATSDAGSVFLLWVMPGYALMFPWTAISSALRGIGIVRPTVLISVVSIVIDILLAPVLIAGWGTGTAFGVKGAGLAATIASIIGTVLLGAYFCRSQRYLNLQRNFPRPNLRHWLRILNIGLPAGSEFALTFFSSAVVYYVIRNFGTTAQAGFAIGSQILQAIVLPGMSVAFAAGPIAGQNYGAGNSERVKQTFVTAIWIGTALMVAITVFLQSWPHSLVDLFGIDAASTTVAVMFLQLMSWTLVAQGLVYTCSTMFQGFGNTLPSLISAGTRFVVFAVPAVWLSTQPQFRLEQVWCLLILSIVLQALVSAWLLYLEFRKRLPPLLKGAPQRP